MLEDAFSLNPAHHQNNRLPLPGGTRVLESLGLFGTFCIGLNENIWSKGCGVYGVKAAFNFKSETFAVTRKLLQTARSNVIPMRKNIYTQQNNLRAI